MDELEVIFCFFFFDFNSSPFDENTLVGWPTVFCLHLLAGTLYATASIPTTTFFLAIGIYFEACSHHFQTIFADINKLVDEHEHEPIEIRRKLKRSLIRAVHFHRFAKRYESLYDFQCHNHCNALTTFSIFESARVLMSATIFFQLFVGILFMSIVNSSLEVVRIKFEPSYQSCFAYTFFGFFRRPPRIWI